MDKEKIKQKILFQIDKELSYEPNGSGFSLIEDLTQNYKDWDLSEPIPREKLNEALNELIDEGEVVMGDDICGPTTLIVSSYKPRTAIQILKAEGKPIPAKVQEYYDKMYPHRKTPTQISEFTQLTLDIMNDLSIINPDFYSRGKK